MHGNSGYEDDARPLAERFERVFGDAEVVVSPSASCVGFVRDHYGRMGVPFSGPPVYELSEFLVDVLGVEDVGASFPHRVTLHPTCHSLRALGVGDRPERLLRAVRGIDLVELERVATECCGFGGTFAVKNADTSMAMLGDKLRAVLDTRAEVCTAVDTSCLMHIGGGLRAPARGRARHAPRRDPGGAGMSAGFPAAARDGARRRAAAAQPRQGDDGDPRQARQRGRASSTTGRRCATPARRSRRARWRRCPSSSSGSRSASRARAASSTGRATAPRRTRSSPASRASTARDEVIKVKSLATDEIGLNEALGRRGIEAIETDLAELIVQLGDDEQSHILVPAIHRNRAEIAALFERTIAHGQKLGLEPASIAEAARRHLREKFLSVPVAVSGANFGIAETGSIGVVESEGNGRMCTTLPRGPHHADGDREGAARVARPRGHAAAAAALLDRRADEPVHVDLDRRARATTGRASSTSCCSTPAARRCWPTRSGARRCTASAARRA